MQLIYTKIKMKNSIILLLTMLVISCGETNNKTKIVGSISNLPDGVLYLYKDLSINRIDSVQTKNGAFELQHTWKDNTKEPMMLGLDHVDKNGVLRAFCYSTTSSFKGSGYNSSLFCSDSLIRIYGEMKNFMSYSDKVKIVTIPSLKGGYQTDAMFHTDGDLFMDINKNTYVKVFSKIKEYPNSFHLLFQINNNRNGFSATEMRNLLKLFKGAIVSSETYKRLKEYNDKRFYAKKIILPLLENNNGEKSEIMDKKYNKHLLVFWASWCGPCVQEIPALKKMYTTHKSKVDFVSISIDKEKTQWKNALERVQMPWKQFVVDENSKEYESLAIALNISTSVPCLILVDKNLKVLKSHVGLMSENELANFIEK
jgi:thiol-disulfide isomerase/thioredoxin